MLTSPETHIYSLQDGVCLRISERGKIFLPGRKLIDRCSSQWWRGLFCSGRRWDTVGCTHTSYMCGSNVWSFSINPDLALERSSSTARSAFSATEPTRKTQRGLRGFAPGVLPAILWYASGRCLGARCHWTGSLPHFSKCAIIVFLPCVLLLLTTKEHHHQPTPPTYNSMPHTVHTPPTFFRACYPCPSHRCARGTPSPRCTESAMTPTPE